MCESIQFGLPPIEAQNQIVAKTGQLMAFCDQLKAYLSEAKTTQLHLADTMAEKTIG